MQGSQSPAQNMENNFTPPHCSCFELGEPCRAADNAEPPKKLLSQVI